MVWTERIFDITKIGSLEHSHQVTLWRAMIVDRTSRHTILIAIKNHTSSSRPADAQYAFFRRELEGRSAGGMTSNV
jgi:hypothetical protein